MKWTLRAVLIGTLMGLILATVAALGYSAHRNARFTAEDLCSQILDQNSTLVESRIDLLLGVASRQGDLNAELARDRPGDEETSDRLARYWTYVLKTHPRITRESIAIDATGEWTFVRRLRDGSLAVGELRRRPEGGPFELRDYRPEDYPSGPSRLLPDADGLDPRDKHWYVDAAKVRRQSWSKTYLLDDIEGDGHLPGVSCSTPVLADDGRLRGVVETSFDILALSRYLKGLAIGQSGFAFILESLPDGTRRVVAHPDPQILIRKALDDGIDQVDELVPIAELGDRRVVAFAEQIPAELDPSTGPGPIRADFDLDGVRYLGAYRRLVSPSSPRWLIGVVLPEADVMGRVDRSNRETYLVGLGILGVASVVGLVVSSMVARPLERVVRQTAQIGRFEVEARPVGHSIIKEVDDLATVIEETKTSLRSFGKFVPTDLIRELIASGREAELGGERRRLTISFCDLQGFTSLAERTPPEELVVQMGDYFGRLGDDIQAEGGTVDKYIGDAIMAFWGAPRPSESHAVSACLAALRGQETLEGLNLRWRREGKPELVARIGIMTGEAVVGNVGSPTRLNYTAMGDPVNLASRLEGLGKFYGTRILIGDPTYLEARYSVLARAVDWVSVKGKTAGLLVHELLARKEDATPEMERVVRLADSALERYRGRDWLEALARFEEILEGRPWDGPATVLAARCRAFLEVPPADDWDGVHHMANK